MQLQNIYKADINRDINGVIKVAQDDERSIKQELEEYIITKELRRHFDTFLNNYEHSISVPTDKIGVWISGFFGSGKSHFLKILSYLLSNNIVGGVPAINYFSDKFGDPMMFSQLETCAKVPTETILFNIDSKSPLTKDKTAILRVFAKVFYEHLGFYGNDLKVAKLEQFISKSGKTEEFREAFERINGGSWEESRDSFAFFEDDIVEALSEALGMSDTAARNWFNGAEEIELSIEQLVKEIKEYIDSKGKTQRLLFMIDEVGQYIGSDSDLMLNLQTIVEEIGTKCAGRVWVMVTSQEAIDSITKISGDDFSKIQGRFNTRLSLSSSSVDEVIKKRILAKTDVAEDALKLHYEKYQADLKSLFTFKRDDAVLDLKGYAGEGEFVETYPFVPYQFKLMQNVLAQIRKHGNSGKHLSGGERSMLSGFQEAAQKLNDKDENALVPFYLFYDTVHTFLESSIRRVVDRCQSAADNGDGIEQYDVDILKLLYLIRYVDDIKATVDSICILMTDDVRTDKITSKQKIQSSLDRLVSQNYVSRVGDTYMFLTDDEQDIAREIRNTPVDSAMVTKAIADIIFGKLYVSKKFRYGKYDFPYDQKIDETVIGQLTGSVGLHFITVASEIYSTDDSVFLMKSSTENEVIVVLSDSQPYFKEIEDAMKIRRYVKGKNITQLPGVIQDIIRKRQDEATAHEKTAETCISKSIAEGRIYAAGDKIIIKTESVKERIEKALSVLIESVYTKLGYIHKNYDSDEDIVRILTSENKQLTADGSPNEDAVREVTQYLEMQKMKQLPTSMGDIHRRYSAVPYGWRETDIAAVVAELIAAQKITLKYSGYTIQPDDKKLPDYLRRKTEIDKAVIGFRVVPPTALIKNVREIMGEYLNCGLGGIPDDESGLIGFIRQKLDEEKTSLSSKLANEYASAAYPGKDIVENGLKLINEILTLKGDSIAFLKKIAEREDDLLDLSEDMSVINTFFRVQKDIFDNASKLLVTVQNEKDYFAAEDKARSAISAIKAIITDQKPYNKIAQLPDLIQTVREVYDRLIAIKREEVIADIQAAMGEIHQSADISKKDIVEKADTAFTNSKNTAAAAESLTSLDAMKIRISSTRQQYLQKLIIEDKPDVDSVTISRSTVCYTANIKTAEDVDEYVSEIRKALLKKLEGHDVLHII